MYADSTLTVSKDAFEKPEKLTINIDCSKESLENDTLLNPADKKPDF